MLSATVQDYLQLSLVVCYLRVTPKYSEVHTTGLTVFRNTSYFNKVTIQYIL